MEQFTVSLPKYNTVTSFDREDFTTLFPDSLITAALQSGENDVPLENPQVTPDVLQLLKDISSTGKYQPVDPKYKRVLDYLGIDLPEPVYHPQYAQLLQDLPNFDVNDFKDYYLQIAKDYDFPELAKYLFDHTDPVAHQQEDYDEFINSANTLKSDQEYEQYSEVSEIALMLLTKRQVLSVVQRFTSILSTDKRQFAQLIVDTLDPQLLEAYLKLVPDAPELYTLTDYILNQMISDPSNYLRYFNMLMVLGPHLALPSDAAKLGRAAQIQGPLYDLIQAASTGDQKKVNALLTGPLQGLVIYFGPIAIYTALIRGNYSIAQDIFQREVQFLQVFYEDDVKEGDKFAIARLDEDSGRWIGKVEGAYLSEPKWITPEGFRVFLNGIRSISNLNPGKPDYTDYIRRRLTGVRDDLVKLI